MSFLKHYLDYGTLGGINHLRYLTFGGTKIGYAFEKLPMYSCDDSYFAYPTLLSSARTY